MRKLTLALALCLSLLGAVPAFAQGAAEIPNRGHAPTKPDGLGRLDLRVFDEQGRPLRGASAKLTSKRPGGFLCETWNTTGADGVAVLPPLKVGTLRLVVKADGYRSQTLSLAPAELGRPLRVTLVRS